MKYVDSYDEKIVAVLHDVVEDTKCTLEYLIMEGYPKHILDAVNAITRRKDEKYFDYIDRCCQNEIAKVVKLADLKDNMSINRKFEPEKHWKSLMKRYEKTIERINGM